MVKTQNFLQAVIDELNGFVLDEPWRLSEESLSVIVPVKRDMATVSESREYITLAEAQDVKIEDTGQIDFVFVKNNESKPLLISRGEIFKGKTQERVAVHSYIVSAGQGARVAVRCIHRSKGISRGAEMQYGGYAPYVINLNDQSSTWKSVSDVSATISTPFVYPTKLFSNGVHGSNQQQEIPPSSHTTSSTIQYTGQINVNEVFPKLDNSNDNLYYSPDTSNTLDFHCRTASLAFNCSNASDDLVNTIEDMSEMIKEMLKKIPPIENQVGAFFLYENEIRGLDVYDLPDSWKSVKEDVIRKEGSDYIKKENDTIFEFKPEKVKALLKKKTSGKFEEKFIHEGKDYNIIEIKEVLEEGKKGQRLIGEAVEFNGKIIHLTMYRA